MPKFLLGMPKFHLGRPKFLLGRPKFLLGMPKFLLGKPQFLLERQSPSLLGQEVEAAALGRNWEMQLLLPLAQEMVFCSPPKCHCINL